LTLSDGIKQGASYRLRYRAKNFNGWGLLSEISYILAANKPAKPYAPIFVSSTVTSVTLRLLAPENKSGTPLTGFILLADQMNIQANFFEVYSGSDSQVTITTATAGITAGLTYRFVLQSTNSYGSSE